MIVLFKEVPGGFERVAEFGDDLDAAIAASAEYPGWQIEHQTEMGDTVLMAVHAP